MQCVQVQYLILDTFPRHRSHPHCQSLVKTTNSPILNKELISRCYQTRRCPITLHQCKFIYQYILVHFIISCPDSFHFLLLISSKITMLYLCEAMCNLKKKHPSFQISEVINHAEHKLGYMEQAAVRNFKRCLNHYGSLTELTGNLCELFLHISYICL